jgi:hypothetical protein
MRRLLVVIAAISALSALAAVGSAQARTRRKPVSIHFTVAGHVVRGIVSCTPTPGAPCFTRTPCPSSCVLPPGGNLPAGQFCPFQVDIGVLVDREYVETLMFSDGTMITRYAGPLVLSFKNHATGKTIVRNVSGRTTTIVPPGQATGTFTGTGGNWLAFGPNGRSNTGEPGLVFTRGFVVVEFDNTTGTTTGFALDPDASQVNGCALLASPS